MSHILIIDAGKTFAHSKGELNHTLTGIAASWLRDAGHHVDVTVVDDGYVVADCGEVIVSACYDRRRENDKKPYGERVRTGQASYARLVGK